MNNELKAPGDWPKLLTDGIVPFDEQQKSVIRGALAKWGDVANLNFTEVIETPTTVGDLRIGMSKTAGDYMSSPGIAGFANYPSTVAGGDVWLSADMGRYLTIGRTITVLHEVGHALGLTHPFGTPQALPANLENSQYTVMTYSGTPLYPMTPLVAQKGPGMLDILAIQEMYGANMTTRTGDDVYQYTPSTSSPVVETIWDAGGNDTISAVSFSNSVTIDLRAGNFSTIAIDKPLDPLPGYVIDDKILTQNIGIAYGVTIENAMGGSGGDTLIGNDISNVLSGNAGADAITGGLGNDTIDGGAGIDTSIYSGTRSSYTLTLGSNPSIADKRTTTQSEGTDILKNVERLKFSDANLAIDMGGHAGQAVKLLGAVFGASSVSNKQYVGIALSLLDGGMSYEQLATAALAATGRTSNTDIASLLWTNLFGTAPTSNLLSPILSVLNSGVNQGAFAVFAADSTFNTEKINLVGLSQTGIEFI